MRKGRSFFITSFIVLTLMNIFCMMEIHRLQGNYLADVVARQEDYLHVVDTAIQTQEDIRSALIEQFSIVYPTSNTTFGILVEDEEVIFYRNEQGVNNLRFTHINESVEVIHVFSEHSVHMQEQNGTRYIVSYRKATSKEHVYYYGIMSSEEGAFARTQSLSVFRHIYFFMGLSSIIIIVIIYQLIHLYAKKEEVIDDCLKQEKRKQTMIENLTSDLRMMRKTRMEDTTFGFLAKEDFVNAMGKLHEPQLSQCRIVKITLYKNVSRNKVYTAAILQRMDVLKCISCEWEKNIFVGLLFLDDLIHLEQFLRTFLEVFSKQYHGNIEDINIVTQKVRSGEDGISTI